MRAPENERAGFPSFLLAALPDTLFQGAAVRGSTKIRARTWDWDKRGSEVTSFPVVDSGGCREIEFVGRWRRSARYRGGRSTTP